MTAGGWIIMTTSLIMVVSLVSFCLYKVLSLPPSEVEAHLHGEGLVNTGDTKNAD